MVKRLQFQLNEKEVYGYEVQYGTDRSFSDLTRVSKVGAFVEP